MKKIIWVFLTSFTFLFLFSGVASAICAGPNGTDSAATGFVPCGVEKNPDGKGLACPCELRHLFIMAQRIFNFAVWTISIPLAGLMIVIGGVMLVVSGGNPGLAGTGKNMLKYSLIGLLLVFSSWVIINTLFTFLGYPNWNIFPG